MTKEYTFTFYGVKAVTTATSIQHAKVPRHKTIVEDLLKSVAYIAKSINSNDITYVKYHDGDIGFTIWHSNDIAYMVHYNLCNNELSFSGEDDKAHEASSYDELVVLFKKENK